MEFNTGYRHALDKEPSSNLNIPPAQIGIPTAPFENQLDAFKARIKVGAKNVELGFMGRGKGSMKGGGTTPGMFGKDERRAIKELAKINKIRTSVHAAPQVQGFAGWNERSFNEQFRQSNIDEVRRAIDFAGDTTEGGAVVVHLGEFPRPLSQLPGEKEGTFQAYPEEAKKSERMIIDSDSGQIINAVRTDSVVRVIDYDKYGRMKIKEAGAGLINPELKELKYEYFVKQAEKNKELFKRGQIKDKRELYPEFLMYKEGLKTKKAEAMSWAAEHSDRYNRVLESIKGEIDEQEKKRIDKGGAPFSAEERRRYKDYLIYAKASDLEYNKSVAVSKMEEADKLDEQIDKAKPIELYGQEKTFDSIARLGIDAMQKTKQKSLPNPLFVAPENIWSETGYGSHPDELKEIIKQSRNKMVDMLKQRGVSEQEAKKKAGDHIKATFDIGHAYTWRKQFQGSDEEFKKWLIGKVDDLAKDGYIGHVHMSDNFGYADEHTLLGEGNVPVNEFINTMKKHGYHGTLLAEPSHNDYKQMLAAWKVTGTPIYRVENRTHTWTDIEHGYFGQTFSPNYLIQTYLPIGVNASGQREPLGWSGIPLE